MKKLSLLLLLLTIGCSDTIISKSDILFKPYIIKEINITKNDTIFCEYFAETRDYVERDDDIWFSDSIGKYLIGDKVRVEFVKVEE